MSVGEHSLDVGLHFVALSRGHLQGGCLLATLPQGLGHLHVRGDRISFTVLHSILPHAVVNAPIDPHVGALATLFVVDVLAFIAATVLPKIFALAVHAILEPVTLVHRLFHLVRQLTKSLHVSVAEFAVVDAIAIVKGPCALGAPFAFLEVAYIVAVVNRLSTVAVLTIQENAALIMVFSLALSVLLGHAALSLGHALIEGALDLGSSRYDLLGSIAVGHATDEATTVLVAIGPLYLALAVWNQFVWSHWVSTHLAGVKRSIW